MKDLNNNRNKQYSITGKSCMIGIIGFLIILTVILILHA